MANTYDIPTPTGVKTVQADTKKNALASVGAPAITSGMLQPQTPFKTTPPKPATGTDGALGFLAAQGEQAATGYAEEAKKREQGLGDFQSQISALLASSGPTALQNDAYAQGGVNTAEAELKDINNQILAEQVALQRQVQELEKNPEGMSTRGLNSEIQRVKDQSLARQADLSVIQLSRQGKFDSAKQIADRAVAALTEARQNKLQALQFMYTENKDLFDKADQRAFETAQANRNFQLDLEKQQYMAKFNQTIAQEQAAYEQKLQQSDPLYQANLRKAQADAEGGAPDVKEINGQDMQWNAQTQQWQPVAVATVAGDPLQLARAQGAIQQIDSLIANPDLAKAVGPNEWARVSWFEDFTGARGDVIAAVEQISSELTVDALKGAKAGGATFGALSDGERELLQKIGTKISTWAIRDKKTEQITGYKTTEGAFKKELDTINNYKKLDYILKGGNLADVPGIQKHEDGTYWAINSDGSVSKLR